MPAIDLTESRLIDESANPGIGTDCRRARINVAPRPAVFASCFLDLHKAITLADFPGSAVAVSQFALTQRLQCSQRTA
jgi:hypothetical protein